MTKTRSAALSLFALAAVLGPPTYAQAPKAPAKAAAPAPVADRLYSAQVVRSYPHDPSAFTEGLLYEDGVLYESTGMVGRSWIRKTRLETGQVLMQRDLKPPYFGEGMVTWKGKVVQLTWQHQVGFTYRASDFAPTGSFKYKGEGWALTKDDRRLIMSDGTDQIRFLNPETLAETGRIRVTFRGQPVANLNELEWVKGEIWANVWQTDVIVRINPRTGQVVGRIVLRGLPLAQDRNGSEDVLNGIAYDAKGDRVLVTGKQWSRIYEIKLTPMG
jgi:glutamine cyclotransferase